MNFLKMTLLDDVKINWRKAFSMGMSILAINVATCVPIKNRVVFEDSYIVKYVLQLSTKISNSIALNYTGWTYSKGDYAYFNSLIYLSDNQPELQELRSGDMLITRVTQDATLVDLVCSSILQKDISCVFDRYLQFDVKKNTEVEIPPNVR